MKSALRLARVVALGLLCTALASCGGSAKPTAKTATGPPPIASLSFPDLIARVKSGVIRIETITCSGGAIGTGFLVSPRLVATVEHVVDGALTITLKRNGRVLGTGTVIGQDQARDLALVRSSRPIAGFNFKLAGRSPRLGDGVAAIGFPLGLPLTVTRGSVSGLDRSIPIGNVDRLKLVQTDAPVNPGNSGGPLLLTPGGSVVGLIDLGTTQANGLAFAVSAGVAAPLLNAWRVAPQPQSPPTCSIPSGGTQAPPPQASPPPQTAPPTRTTPSTYTGTSFAIQYPGGWVIQNAETDHGTYIDTTITAPTDPSWLIRVDEGPRKASPSPEAAGAPVIAALRKEPGYTELDMSPTTFAGYPALRWEFTVPEGGVLMHKVDFFFTDGNGNDWAVLGQLPDSEWSANQAALQSYLETFQPS
jgi:S1-C subfamily serine protease